MAQPMRECPVCEAIVLLHQDHCTICGHDLSLPAPEPDSELADEPVPEPDEALAAEEIDENARLPVEDPAEGVSVFVAIGGFAAAALLIFWFVGRGGPLDEDDAETVAAPVAAADEQLVLAKSVCAGGGSGVDGATRYDATPGIHPTAVLIGDLTGSDIATSTDLFPPEWIVDVATEPLTRSELVLCMSRQTVGEVESPCASANGSDALVRVEASYRVSLHETATGDALVTETVGPEVFGPCPAEAGSGPERIYADPDPVALVNLVVPVIFTG